MGQVARRKAETAILVTGYARLPEAEGKGEQAYFGITLTVDPHRDVILDGECTCIFELGREFFRNLVVGRSLTHDLDDMIQDFETRLAVPSQKTVVRSLQNAYNRYREFRLARGLHAPIERHFAVQAVAGSGNTRQ